MNCQRVIENYTAFTDYELAQDLRHLIEEHLGKCAKCRKEFSALNSMLNKLHSLASIEAKADFDERLMNRIAAGELPPRQAWFLSPPVRMTGYAVAAGVALALVFTQWMRPSNNFQNTAVQPLVVVKQPLDSINSSALAASDSLQNISDTLKLKDPFQADKFQALHLVNQTP